MHFIVLEGLDGAGKSTQFRLLREYIGKTGKKSQFLHFPRTEAPYYGDLVARFLRGEFGPLAQVHPMLVALLYAGDRSDAAGMIQGWLSEGDYVIADRYVGSNIAYQCAKLKEIQQKKELKDWILDLEYSHNAIPKPDATFFLDVPFRFTEENLTKERTDDDRTYLKGKKDIHEADLSFQQQVREEYLSLCRSGEMIRIDCSTANGQMMAAEEIHHLILTGLRNLSLITA
jgi:dTMP kinase